MSKEILLQAYNLEKVYPNGQIAVDDVSFTLQAGEVLAILGPNGAGKTTSIKMMLGLIRPTAGVPDALGHNMSIASEARKATPYIGAVLEGARNSYWRMSALENLLYFGRMKGLSLADAKVRSLELLEELDLSEYCDQDVGTFSRGMKQKLAIAIALMNKPRILALDEPTIGLDIEAARAVEARIHEQATLGNGVLLTTHSMQLVERVAHQLLIISEGEVVAYGDADSLRKKLDTRRVVEIEVQSQISDLVQAEILDRFLGLQMVDDMTFEWQEPDQAQIIALYTALDDHGYRVSALNYREPSLEDVFLNLTRGQKI